MKHIIFNLLTGFTIGEIVIYNNEFWKIVNYRFTKIFSKYVYIVTIYNKNKGFEYVSSKVLKKIDKEVNRLDGYNKSVFINNLEKFILSNS